jgi:carbonic anhydrase
VATAIFADLEHKLPVPRRALLRITLASTIGLALGNAVAAKEIKTPPKPQNVLSPDAALRRLMAGNAR